ncbi:MAG: M23 family metallopeptidase [Clostridia bacterium]|nr:M23 family metallopeptidase [Clostridia bacterium]
MKNRIVTLAIVVAIIIMPTVIALSSYIYSKANPVTEGSVSKIELTMPNGESETYLKSDKGSSSLYSTLIGMHKNAKKVSSLPSGASSFSVYKVSYSSYNKVYDYTYYLSSDSSKCFFRDGSGKLYKVEKKNAVAFLKTEFATDVFPNASQPTLNVGRTDNVLPSSINWKYIGINGTYADGETNKANGNQTCVVSGGLQLDFDIAPDYIYAVIKDQNGNVVFDNEYENIDPNLFADNTVYDVKVIAKWYKTENRSNYGEAEYLFTANVQSPPVFYLSEHASLKYGDFVIVSAKNIVDPSLITFSSEPAIEAKPVFYEYGGYYHAIIPFSLKDEAANKGALDYTFTLGYGDTTRELSVTLVKRSIGKDYQSIEKTTIEELRNKTTIAEFNETVAPYLGAKEDKLYWMNDNKIMDPTTRKIRSGFGINIILEKAGITYSHEGVNYYVKEGDSVKACLPGKVVYVGETTLSGRTVIIEHGGGLKSLYAHMSSTNVTVGQEIGKGTVLGIVGSTGFCTGTTLHFGLYVYDTPVRYYNYETEGVSVHSTVAEAIGLK